MEDTLDVNARPYDPLYPVVCMDESSKQLVADVTPPLPMQPGQVARQDYEYQRCGTANIFMAFEPLTGQRHVKITEHRTGVDFAEFLRDLSDVHYDQSKKIVLTSDNLNTHKLSVLYQAFPAEEARRLYERFEMHHTPKHGSWLNMAECELSVLSRQCLDRRIDNALELKHEVDCWQTKRNATRIQINWRFTTADARIKLARLYPVLAPVN
jgi:hypothetical protein